MKEILSPAEHNFRTAYDNPWRVADGKGDPTILSVAKSPVPHCLKGSEGDSGSIVFPRSTTDQDTKVAA